MFTVQRKGENRLHIELSGKLDTEEMKIALDELVTQSEHIENGKMLYDVIDFHLERLAQTLASIRSHGGDQTLYDIGMLF